VEPNPSNYAKLIINRPHELARVHAAVCAKRQVVHFIQAKNAAVGGIWEFADDNFKRTWWHRPGQIASNTSIECVPFLELVRENVNVVAGSANNLPPQPTTTTTTTTSKYYFDFFSLDIEGGEIEVLSTLDFTSIEFGVILVEASLMLHRNLAVISLLEQNGYRYEMNQARSLWFVHNDFYSIYRGILF
jgi:Methyltransferase FkbM domain